MRSRRLALALLACTLLAACDNGAGRGKGPENSERLVAFSDEAAFDSYLAKLGRAQRGRQKSEAADGEGSAASEYSIDTPAPGSANESITNTQEVGVDEGDIVKNVGSYLVVLRKGRLYAVDVGEPGAARQSDAVRVARTDALNSGVWYDEALVSGDRVYVIGYRYSLRDVPGGKEVGDDGFDPAGATEVNTFRLANGKFERLATSFIESWDYYSSDNYASRLVDGKLVFYMPSSVFRSRSANGSGSGESRPEPTVPRTFALDEASGRLVEQGPLFGATDVYRPLVVPTSPTYHSVVRCNLPDDGGLDCSAKALLGDWGREFYVSPKNVFLWTTGRVYAFGIEDQVVSVHSAQGTPADQFAFREADGKLYVAVTTGGEDERPGGGGDVIVEDGGYAGRTGGGEQFVLLALPLAKFDDRGEQSLGADSTVLSGEKGRTVWVGKERWVGKFFVAAVTTSTDDEAGAPAGQVLLVHDTDGGTTKRLETGLSVSRVEALGTNRALVSGSVSRDGGGADSRGSGAALGLRVVDLASAKEVGTDDLAGLGEGESRSHGFFFSPDGDSGAGTFGLPVVGPGPGEEPASTDASPWWGGGISNIAFFRVAGDGGVSQVGAISSSGEEGVCEVSCVDWYGNTRPIFLKGRTFALMGSELVEVSLGDGVVRRGSPVVLG